MNLAHPKTRWSPGRFAVAAGVLVTAGLIGYYGVAAGSGPSTRNRTARDSGGDNVNFDRPYSATQTLDSLSEAASLVSFTPVSPETLGHPLGIYTAADLNDRATKTIAIVFQHPVFGRFMINESPSAQSQGVEAPVIQCNEVPRCDADWHDSRLLDGTTGAMHVGDPRSSSATTGFMWLSGDVLFDLLGPASTFDEASALKVANVIENAGRAG